MTGNATDATFLVCAAAVAIVLILAVRSYNVAQVEFLKVAVEHGCAVVDDRVTCAQGDRR